MKRGAEERVFPGKWELPGGKREFFETCERGIFRAVMEEAGFPIRLIGVLSTFDYVIETDEQIVDSTQITFLAEPTVVDPAVLLSKEHQDSAWIIEADIGLFEMSDEMSTVVRHAFKRRCAYRAAGLWMSESGLCSMPSKSE